MLASRVSQKTSKYSMSIRYVEKKSDDLFNANPIKMIFQPNRIYYLEDSDGNALNWCETIEKARQKYIKTS